MITADQQFYYEGGAVPPNAPSYVVRRADDELHAALVRGEFCYVLTARQMGKSSLMGHTAARLRKEGAAVVRLDLTAIGQNITPEQWYGGLLDHMARQLDLEDELEEYWLQPTHLGPLQRWMTALRQVVLSRCPGRLVVFIDEIDFVRSLPFKTDEFFAAIRECYNRRVDDPEFARLTFCLLGVATPSDLIQDTRTTPFNIGHRIDLTDFSEAEATPLAQGLRQDDATNRALLERVLYWTHGHPYLTQRLCQAIAEEFIPTSAVDRVCTGLFLSPQARERDDNLLFVRDRLLKSDVDRAGLLDLYRQVRAGKQVSLDDMNQLVSILRLSGITRVAEGALRVRNRIYERVFDQQWVTVHMPDAELRRQRAAYRRGLVRATGVFAAILATMAGLALTAWTQAQRANRVAQEEKQQRRLAQQGQQLLRQSLYAARVNLALQAEAEGNIARAQQLLEAQRPDPGQEDLRGFEWRYLWRQCQDEARFTLPCPGVYVDCVAFSPDGRTLASAASDGIVKLWDVPSKREIGTLVGHREEIRRVAFSPDGKTLASSSEDRTVKIWNIASRRLVASVTSPGGVAGPLAFSPDGKILAFGGQNHTVRLWNLDCRREVAVVPGYSPSWGSNLAISPDGRTLAMSQEDDFRVRLWDLISRREIVSLKGHTGSVQAVAFSPDGTMLASGGDDDTVRLWAVAPRGRTRSGSDREIALLRGHANMIGSLAFSPDGRMLASGGDDPIIRLWDVAAKQELATLRGHRGAATCVAFSPDGKTLASSGDGDHTVKLWDVAARLNATTVMRQNSAAVKVTFSPAGRVLATSHRDGTIKLWETGTGRQLAILKGHTAAVGNVAFSPDGKLLASGGLDRTLRLWDIASRRTLLSLPGYKDGPCSLAFSPDGQTLAWQSDRMVKLWHVPTRRLVAALPRRSGHLSVSFSPDGKSLAAFSQGDTLTLWDVATQRAGPAFRGSAVAKFSPDGRTLATLGYAGASVKLWDIPLKRLVASLKTHGQPGWDFAFSPDGRTLAAASGNTITLWSLAIHQEVATLKGHTAGVNSVAFSPDGNILASTSSDGTVRLWHAAPFRETDLLQVIAGASDRTVRLEWRPIPGVQAYDLYRGSKGATRSHLRKLASLPANITSYTDRSTELANGQLQSYAVVPVQQAVDGKVAAGPREVVQQVTPVVLPPGFLGYGINEGAIPGTALFEAATGAITLRGSGDDIWGSTDGCYFVAQPVLGNLQITVKAITGPTLTHEGAKAGLMVRDSLDPGARQVCLVTTPARGLICSWRSVRNEEADYLDVIEHAGLKLPITLRLTRQGEKITAEYSADNGRTFRWGSEPYLSNEPLPNRMYVGLIITSTDPRKVGQAKFRDLDLKQH